MFEERCRFPSAVPAAALGQHRSTQRKIPHGRDDEARLTADIVELVKEYDRYGYRKIAELLDGEIFYTLREAQIIIESWRRHYNTVRPHASIGYRAPAPEVFVPALAAWPAAQSRPAPPAMLPLAPRPTLN